MKRIISICIMFAMAAVCISPCWPAKDAEDTLAINADENILKAEQEQEAVTSVEDGEEIKRPDEAVLYNELIDPNSWVIEYRKKYRSELPPPSFRPVKDALSAEALGLLTPTIYSRKISLPLEKGGELVLGRDQENGSSTIYLDPHVVNDADSVGTQYGFYFLDYLYMSYNRPNPELPTSQVRSLDDFRSLEIYDSSGEPVAQYDERAAGYAIIPEWEYEKTPSTNFFVDKKHEFIPCDGGVRFGPCYFHYEGENELLPSDILSDDYCDPFEAWMVVLRLSDGKILDCVGIWLEETEFNVFELKAVSLGADFAW